MTLGESIARTRRRRELKRRVAAVPEWWHTIDLGDGVVTPGHKGGGGSFMEEELARLRLPELGGKSVLDVGTWDGYYAFEAERRGAARVTAIDHYVWWHREAGRRGFDLAHKVLGSSVHPVEADFMEVDLDALGTFDVVLFLGVLYHLEDPLRGLRRLARITTGTAVIETEAVAFPGYEDHRLCEFFADDELLGDPTNFWAPNLVALRGMCETAGFGKFNLVQGPPELAGPGPHRYRAIAHVAR